MSRGEARELTHPESSVMRSMRSFISLGVTSWSRRKTTPRSETGRSISYPIFFIYFFDLYFLFWGDIGNDIVLTCHGKISDHFIPPFEQISHLKTFILTAQDGGEILALEAVQRARVFEGLLQTRAGLDVAAKVLAVERLLTCGEFDGRHGGCGR